MRGVVHPPAPLQSCLADHRAAVCMRGHDHQLSQLRTIAFLAEACAHRGRPDCPNVQGRRRCIRSGRSSIDGHGTRMIEILGDAFTRLRTRKPQPAIQVPSGGVIHALAVPKSMLSFPPSFSGREPGLALDRAPRDTPCANCFWNRANTISTGITLMIMPANRIVRKTRYSAFRLR